MLRTDGVAVEFGGIRALAGASFEAQAGSVTGLIGPNGAGKTTLFNVITGLQRPTAGRVHLDGKDVTRTSARHRARLGLSRTFQRLELFGSLTIRDNVLVSLEAVRGSGGGRSRRATADGLLDRVGLTLAPDTRADVLTTGQARLLEMARALASDPKVLLLDESSSGLDNDESAVFGDLVTSLAGEGRAVLLVEHDMDLVMRICDYIYVLDFGVMIAENVPDEIRRDPRVQQAYLGTEAIDEPLLTAEAAP